MLESHKEYWSRRSKEHARLALASSHRAAVAAHNALAHAYRRRAEQGRDAH